MRLLTLTLALALTAAPLAADHNCGAVCSAGANPPGGSSSPSIDDLPASRSLWDRLTGRDPFVDALRDAGPGGVTIRDSGASSRRYTRSGQLRPNARPRQQ